MTDQPQEKVSATADEWAILQHALGVLTMAVGQTMAANPKMMHRAIEIASLPVDKFREHFPELERLVLHMRASWLSFVTARRRWLPPLPAGMPPAPDEGKLPAGFKPHPWASSGQAKFTYAVVDERECTVLDSLDARGEDEARAAAWAHSRRNGLPEGYLLNPEGETPDDIVGVCVKIGDHPPAILATFEDREDAREFAWRCAARPQHVAFVLAYPYEAGVNMRIVIDWTDDMLAEAHAFIDARQIWFGLAPATPAFIPGHTVD